MSADLKSSLNQLLSRELVERTIRVQLPEHTILQLHDAVYAPLKSTSMLAQEQLETALAEELGPGARQNHGRKHMQSIVELRRLLDANAKERELQNALLRSGLLAVRSQVVQEVTIKALGNRKRVDLVRGADDHNPAQVIELKRGSHLLVARRGKASEHVARALEKAFMQVEGYAQLLSDQTTVRAIERGWDLDLHGLELRLVAGRRLPDTQACSFLSAVEAQPRSSGLRLQIYTWDALLAELERILD